MVCLSWPPAPFPLLLCVLSHALQSPLVWAATLALCWGGGWSVVGSGVCARDLACLPAALLWVP